MSPALLRASLSLSALSLSLGKALLVTHYELTFLVKHNFGSDFNLFIACVVFVRRREEKDF